MNQDTDKGGSFKVRQERDAEVTVKIYGPAASRAARALWIVHELGIPFEHVAMEMKDLKNADYLKINPNGNVPVLVDGDFKLFESMAINLYLAAKHKDKGLLPASLEDQALCHQWSFWGMAEVEKPLLTILTDMFMTAPDKRKPDALAEAQKALPKPFGVLNGALQGREYLLGGGFTVADLNLASICSWAKPIKFDFSPFPNVSAWLDRCLRRPAYKAARTSKWTPAQRSETLKATSTARPRCLPAPPKTFIYGYSSSVECERRFNATGRRIRSDWSGIPARDATSESHTNDGYGALLAGSYAGTVALWCGVDLSRGGEA